MTHILYVAILHQALAAPGALAALASLEALEAPLDELQQIGDLWSRQGATCCRPWQVPEVSPEGGQGTSQ